ncbi:protein G12-like [Condylostylus longicornis]|uniref:protein G12-like n=1 Tax=Condylostylus longicornis TaxID=2530218 RepID=UPI00244E33EF|nr:protein G12-like [Condylostylus longicornis]
MKYKIPKTFLVLAFTSFCLAGILPPPPGDKCVSPNGKGLAKAVHELFELIPAYDWLEIYMVAVSNDPEVIRVMEYLTGEEFNEIIDTMNSQSEYIEALEFFCEQLHFDIYFYINSLAEVIGLPVVTRPPKLISEVNNYRREGFNGMLQDLYDTLPHDKLKETWRRLYEEDEYLRAAMDLLSSEEFRLIGDAIEDLDAFKNLMQRLRDIGVDADGLLKKIMDFFGWRPHRTTTAKYF